MPISFYDRGGLAIAYSEDNQHIFLFGGQPVAYLDDDAVYSYRGELMGWFEGGWLRDKNGRCVAFSEQAAGGPQRPLKKTWPFQSPRLANPVKEHKDPRSLRPIHSSAWSLQTAEAFFSLLPIPWPGGLGSSIDWDK